MNMDTIGAGRGRLGSLPGEDTKGLGDLARDKKIILVGCDTHISRDRPRGFACCRSPYLSPHCITLQTPR
jgi:hypothetical protein